MTKYLRDAVFESEIHDFLSQNPQLVDSYQANEPAPADHNDPHSTSRLDPGMHRAQMIAPLEMQSPKPFTGDEPLLQVGKDGSFFGMTSAKLMELLHVLVLGMPGSGKTTGVMIKLLIAFLHYALPCGKRPTLLVVDPKRELLAVVEEQLAGLGQKERLYNIGGPGTPPVLFFTPGEKASIRERWSTLESLLPYKLDEGSHAYWHLNAVTVCCQLLELQQRATEFDPQARLLTEWAQQCGLELDSTNSFVALEALLPHLMKSGFQYFAKPLNKLKAICARYGISAQDAGVLDMYGASPDAFDQYLYVVTVAKPVLALLADRQLAKLVNLDPVPDLRCPNTDLMSLVEHGTVITLQPWQSTPIADTAVKAVKSKYHACVFARFDQERPCVTLADEFHRFVSNDPVSGDAAYIDRSRGFRGIVIYATQSIHALQDALGADEAARSSTKILLANTPTKIFMRTTDEQTVDVLKGLLPHPPALGQHYPHVVDVRRPASLTTGQAYVVWGNGKWALRSSH